MCTIILATLIQVSHLVHNVQELQEDGGEPTGLVGGSLVGAVGEPVTKGQPLLLHQRLEAFDGAVVGVQKHLGHTHHLHRPARQTMNQILELQPFGHVR